jgi:hypothetical protein
MTVSGAVQVCFRLATNNGQEDEVFKYQTLSRYANFTPVKEYARLRNRLGAKTELRDVVNAPDPSGTDRTQPVRPDAHHRPRIATLRKCQSATAILPSFLPLRLRPARWADAAASTRGSRLESPIPSRTGPGASRPTRRPDPAPKNTKNSCGSGRGSASSPRRRRSRAPNRHHLGWTLFTERGRGNPERQSVNTTVLRPLRITRSSR